MKPPTMARLLETIEDARYSGLFDKTEFMKNKPDGLEAAPMFDFGQTYPSPEHVHFGLDLLSKDLFNLPFPVVSFRYKTDDGLTYMLTVWLNEAGHFCMFKTHWTGLGDDHYLPTIGAMDAIIEPVLDPDEADKDRPTAQIDALFGSYVSDKIMKVWYDRNDVTLCYRLDGQHFLLTAIGFVVMLMSKGVEVAARYPDVKLNRAREKKGRPPLTTTYVVNVRTDGIRYINHADGSQTDITGHRRGSPVMHWRRGHFRTIHRGTSDERIIPIAPTLVSANEFGQPIAKEYRVKG